MVGERVGLTRSQYCRPGEPAIEGVHHQESRRVALEAIQLSRRRVALDERNRVPEWPWPISKAHDGIVLPLHATAGFKDAATSSARDCRNSREKTNDKMRQTREVEERQAKKYDHDKEKAREIAVRTSQSPYHAVALKCDFARR